MATSFAAFASQFLHRQQNAGASSLSSSQPMFFSFTTDDGSRTGHPHDLDDLDDPHLIRASEASQQRVHLSRDGDGDDDDDPYLRLDEDVHGPSSPPPRVNRPSSPSGSSASSKGWLAHQTVPLRPHSRSPSLSSSSNSSPPPDIFTNPVPAVPNTRPAPRVVPPPPPPVSLSLTDSLLPRDGHSRPIDVFSLPDPRHFARGRRKYNDYVWTAVWCTAVSLCLVSSLLVLFLARKPPNPSPPSSPSRLPYTTFLHTIPLLTILTFLSALAAYAHIFLLQIFVKPVMIATSVFIPATLLISAIWAFVGSFMWDGDQEPTWGETVGFVSIHPLIPYIPDWLGCSLRLFAIIPLVLAFITGRRLIHLPREIHTASVTLTLTTRLLLANPFLLALSPTILLISLLASIPFLTLAFRLLLIGYFSHPPTDPNAWEWHVRGWAHWSIAAVLAIWLWTWAVARGVLRVTCAGVIGAWYFAEYVPSPIFPELNRLP
jgi:hypothetical protein